MKQLEPRVVEVDGKEFYITPFPAFRAANLSGELTGVLAPLFAAIVPLLGTLSDGVDTALENIDPSAAVSALKGLDLDGNTVEKMMKKLLLGGHIATTIEDEDGNEEPVRLDEDTINELFCGQVDGMFILCFKVISVNFGGFFKKLAGRFGAESTPERKARKPRKIS